MKDDPLETTDLWATPKDRPEHFEEMAAAMRAHIQASGNVPWQKE